MDICVRNLPRNATTKQITEILTPAFKDFGITFFHVEKIRDKEVAFITVKNTEQGSRFLQAYGPSRPTRSLNWAQKTLLFSRAKNQPSEVEVRALEYEEQQQKKGKGSTQTAPASSYTGQQQRQKPDIHFIHVHCGLFDYAEPSRVIPNAPLTFMPCFTDARPGTAILGRNTAVLVLGNPTESRCRVDINYRDCHDITIGMGHEPCITFNTIVNPRIYQIESPLSAAFAALHLEGQRPKKPPLKVRQSAIEARHGKVIGACAVYRIVLPNSSMVELAYRILKGHVKTCPVRYIQIGITTTLRRFSREVDLLNAELKNPERCGSKPFAFLYQLDRLATNGRLPPWKVRDLIPQAIRLLDQHGLVPILRALRRLYNEVPPASFEHDAAEFSVNQLGNVLERYASNYSSHDTQDPYELVKRHTHLNLIHRLIVTPTRLMLTGPEPEPTNRVLRRYAQSSDNFIRVVFQDEDGSSVRHDPSSDHSRIYNERFKFILARSINIAGSGFSFLGFSHSSLRNQACWFMRAFIRDNRLMLAKNVLGDLGNFSAIRIPAKCAARIGQNFTETNATIEIKPEEVSYIDMVTRNGRDFSDGVGTISLELLKSVWRVYGLRRLIKPTALQIRFQGAKGMVSLDSRLQGRRLCLRKNMKKYETATVWQLEVCGAAFRPLPMILNRGYIKILEDLGVPMQAFQTLQQEAIEDMRKMLTQPINTATFLESSYVTMASKLPSLVRLLAEIGVDYREDAFLNQIVEMVAVSKLRDLKYRGRIPVPKGWTLYGIMDETGILKEGQVFIVTEQTPKGGKQVLVKRNITVTRSPALHPGDMQSVDAVNVPESSPLRKLSNVIVFSQHGKRDLPSMLSGGDLDGDIYNIIWDDTLLPQRYYTPAEYPRIAAQELDREVTPKDMSDFFVTFMESDVLGMLANVHVQLADFHNEGTLHPGCVKLAEMASTAVDFSKTGIPVNIADCPAYPKLRPDFMAPTPRAFISDIGSIDFEDKTDEVDEAFENLDAERRPFRHYHSIKTLGYLYRAIDEGQFLKDLHRGQPSIGGANLIKDVYKYMTHWANQYVPEWKHHLPLARDIRGTYEDGLADLMHDYAPSHHSPVSEPEVLAGSILGRHGGAQDKPLREKSQALRERYQTIAEYASQRIIHGDQIVHATVDLDDLYDTYDDREGEALPRALACLHVAVHDLPTVRRRIGTLRSFGYLAAEVTLREFRRYRITTFGSHILPLMDRGKGEI